MQVEVVLPPLGEDGPGEAKVSFWFHDVGQTVNEGEDLVEMVTDKASFTVPAPAAGRLVETAVGEGDVVTVGRRIGVIETED